MNNRKEKLIQNKRKYELWLCAETSRIFEYHWRGMSAPSSNRKNVALLKRLIKDIDLQLRDYGFS